MGVLETAIGIRKAVMPLILIMFIIVMVLGPVLVMKSLVGIMLMLVMPMKISIKLVMVLNMRMLVPEMQMCPFVFIDCHAIKRILISKERLTDCNSTSRV